MPSEPEKRDYRQLYHLLIGNLVEYAIFVIDPEGILATWNMGVERILGYKEDQFLGNPVSMIFTPEDVRKGVPDAELHRAATDGHAPDERWHERNDGRRIYVDGVVSAIHDNGDLIGYLKVMRDSTDRKLAEEQLRQAQKMESVGILAAGIAHDFNNLLTGIMGNASLALNQLSPVHPRRPMLEDIIKAATQAANLVQQLRAYAGRGPIFLRRFDLSQLVSDMVSDAERWLQKGIRLQLDLPKDLPELQADPNQIQQIILSLLTNAAEAIDGAHGTVRISTGTRECFGQPAAVGACGPGSYLCLEVTDSGRGMDSETQKKIFDPFFSTKFLGRGLSLAAVAGIVQSHSGAIQVESAPGKGSTFRILLPVKNGLFIAR